MEIADLIPTEGLLPNATRDCSLGPTTSNTQCARISITCSPYCVLTFPSIISHNSLIPLIVVVACRFLQFRLQCFLSASSPHFSTSLQQSPRQVKSTNLLAHSAVPGEIVVVHPASNPYLTWLVAPSISVVTLLTACSSTIPISFTTYMSSNGM